MARLQNNNAPQSQNGHGGTQAVREPTAANLAMLDSASQFGASSTAFAGQQTVSEQDLIRQLIETSDMAQNRLKKVRGSTNGFDKGDLDSETASKAGNREIETSIKLCQRIWSGYTKFIRSQCNKDRVIDSQFFGTFFKRDITRDDEADGDMKKASGYCYVADLKRSSSFSEFKLVSGPENFNSLPKGMVEGREHVQVNLSAIAHVCNCALDQVATFLQKVRELAFSVSLTKKRLVVLNLSVGQLWIYPNHSVEFRTSGQAGGDSASMAPSSVGEIRSQYLDPERTATHKFGSRENSIFGANTQKSKIQSLLKNENEPQNNYSYLSDFLKSHIVRSKTKVPIGGQSHSIDAGADRKSNAGISDTYSNISKKNKNNNALIERAAREVQTKRRGDASQQRTVVAAGAAAVKDHGRSLAQSDGKLEKLQNIQSAFLMQRNTMGGDMGYQQLHSQRDAGQSLVDPDTLSERKSTISGKVAAQRYLSNRLSRSRGGGREKVSNVGLKAEQQTRASDEDKRSFVSLKSRQRQVNSQGAQRVNHFGASRKFSEDAQSGVGGGNGQGTAAIENGNGQQDAASSKSYKDMNRFYQTASHLYNLQKATSPQLKTPQVPAVKLLMPNTTQQSRKSSNDDDVRTIIGLALNRKQISSGYHSQAYPYFMRSQGPFKIYDHATSKGQQFVQNLNDTNQQAHARFQEECQKIKEAREFEREQFGWQKHKEDLVAAHKQELKRKNNLENLSYLAQQIKNDRDRKNLQKEMERQYFKPHFGPEETDEQLDSEADRVETQKRFVRAQLVDQMNLKANMKIQDFQSERLNDLKNIRTAQGVYAKEEAAKHEKYLCERTANKNNWESQMRDRQLREQMEKLFY